MTIQCKVKSIQPLACNTYQIILTPPSPVSFKAGQYLMVVMGEKDKRPFSIASSPCRPNGELELHIGAAEHNAYAQQVVDVMALALESGSHVTIDAPHGDAWIQEESERPLLLIAGGTGFSYVRSILDYCLMQKRTQPIYLYWGARNVQQLYAQEELIKIADQQANVHFIPVIEEASEGWQGKTGNVLQAIDDDFDNLESHDL